MGIWMGALGRLTISPEPTRELIMEYLLFSEFSCPDSYREDDVAWNPWFFGKDGKLISHIGKRVESKEWYYHLKENFFEKRGYQLIGDPNFVWEGDEGIDIWKIGNARSIEHLDSRKAFEEKYLK